MTFRARVLRLRARVSFASIRVQFQGDFALFWSIHEMSSHDQQSLVDNANIRQMGVFSFVYLVEHHGMRRICSYRSLSVLPTHCDFVYLNIRLMIVKNT